MDLIIKITALLALISIIILAFYLIATLSGVTKFLDEAADALKFIKKEISSFNTKVDSALNDFSDLKQSVIKSLDELKSLKDKSMESLDNFDDMSVRIRKSVTNIENRTDKFIKVLEPLEDMTVYAVNKIVPPVKVGAKVATAVFKAIGAFKARLKK